MKSFKQYLKEAKKKRQKNIHTSIARGPEFGMVGAGRSGLMQADQKQFKKKKQRKEGKAIARKALRGEY
jgi:hypothetical protein